MDLEEANARRRECTSGLAGIVEAEDADLVLLRREQAVPLRRRS